MCLSIDGIPVLEGKGHSTVCVDGGVVQKPQPEAVGELGELSVLRFQELQEVLHLRLPGLLVAELPGGCFVLSFGSFEAAVQGIKAFLVFRLVKGYGGVFRMHLCIIWETTSISLRYSFCFAVSSVVSKTVACASSNAFMAFFLPDSRILAAVMKRALMSSSSR